MDNPPPVYIDMVTAVQRLTADLSDGVIKDRDGAPVRDAATLAWRKRELAIELLHTALRAAALVAWARLLSGEFVQLTGIDWQTASLWREIILGGVVRALPEDEIAPYDGARILLDAEAFEAWRLKRLAPTADVEEVPADVPPPGPRPGQLSPKQRACELALAILNDDAQRPQRVHGWKIRLAHLVHQRLGAGDYQVDTIARHIRDTVADWERQHPGG